MSGVVKSTGIQAKNELLVRVHRLIDQRGSAEVFLILGLREIVNFSKWKELGFQSFSDFCEAQGLDAQQMELGVRVVNRFLAEGCHQTDLVPVGLDRLICINNLLELIPEVLDLRRIRKLFDMVIEEGMTVGDLTQSSLAELVGNVLTGSRPRLRRAHQGSTDSDDGLAKSEDEQRMAVLGRVSSQILVGPKLRRIPRPTQSFVTEENWRMMNWTTMLGNNAHLVGPTGSGKSTLVALLAEKMKLPFFEFNFGGILDPRSELLGTTQLCNGETVFVDSPFLQAIQVPNAVILLDEFNRCEGMFLNLLTPALINDRSLVVAERTHGTRVKVAGGVSFFAISNHGPEYMHTAPLDRAVVDRFQVTIVINYPPPEEEEKLLRIRHSSLLAADAAALVRLADAQRKLARLGEYKTYVSTRMLLAAAQLTSHGEPLWWAVEYAITNKLSDSGDNSERVKFRLLAQKYIRSV
jgi:cobaltochelatase CobS